MVALIIVDNDWSKLSTSNTIMLKPMLVDQVEANVEILPERFSLLLLANIVGYLSSFWWKAVKNRTQNEWSQIDWYQQGNKGRNLAKAKIPMFSYTALKVKLI